MTNPNQKAVATIILIVIIVIVIIVVARWNDDNRRHSKNTRQRFLTNAGKIEVNRHHSSNSSSNSPSSSESLPGEIGDRCNQNNSCGTGLTCVNGRCVCPVPLPVRLSEVNVTANLVSISWFPSNGANNYGILLYQVTGNPPSLTLFRTIPLINDTSVNLNDLPTGNYIARIFASSSACGTSNTFTSVPFTTDNTNTLQVDTLEAREIIDEGTKLNPHPTKVAVTGSQFDCSEPNPAFPNFDTHSPVKPAKVPDILWTEMLTNLSEEQKRLTRNFIAGRNALGLPQFEKINPDGETGTFVRLVATKTTTLSTFNLEANTWTFEPEVGWDLHVTNKLYRDFINPDTITASGTFSFSGNTGIDEGTLRLDDPSIILEYGLVLQGPGIPWGTTIYDTSRAAEGIYGLSVSTRGNAITDQRIDFLVSRWGPKTVSIFVQAGNLNQISNVPVIVDIAHDNRQFEPTIDYSNDDNTGLSHTGEAWVGSKLIPSGLSLQLSLVSSVTDPIVQLAIFAETAVDVYFKPPNCPTRVTNGKRLVKQGQAPGGVGNSSANTVIVNEGKVMIAIVSAVATEVPGNPGRVTITYTLAEDASRMDTTKPFLTTVQNSNPAFNGEFGEGNETTINGNIVTIQENRTATLVVGATSTGGRMFRDNACFAGEALVLMADGTNQKQAKDVRVGDKVASLNGETLEIIATTLHPRGQGEKRIVDMSHYAPGLIISDYHRVQIDGQWVRPYDLPSVRIYHDDIDLYNFVADRRQPIIVNGLPATTLGMYCEGGTHDFDLYPTQKFWCTDAIVDHLKSRSDWPNIVFSTSQIQAMKQV